MRQEAFNEKHKFTTDAFIFNKYKLYLQEQSDAGHRPLGGFVFSFQIKRPNVRGAPHPSFVDRAFVHVAEILLVLGDRLNVNDRHAWEQLFQSRIHDDTSLNVPSGSLHV